MWGLQGWGVLVISAVEQREQVEGLLAEKWDLLTSLSCVVQSQGK